MPVAASVVPRAHNRVFSERVSQPRSLGSVLRAVGRQLCRTSWREIGIVQWWPRVTRETLLADAIACATVAVILIPQGMAYAVLAGLDPVYGLISATIPLLVYALFTTSSQVAVGPVAPTSILMSATIASVTGATPRSPEFLRYHLVLAFLSGCFQLVCGFLRLGFIASLLSWPVMSGFSSGAAVIIITSQLPDLLRLDMVKDNNNVFRQVARTVTALPSAHWITAAIGIPALLLLLFWRDIRIRGWSLPKRTPLPLLVVLVLTLVSWAADLRSMGVKTVGDIPAALPAPRFPITDVADVKLLLGSAIVIGSINYIQTVTLAVLFGKKAGETVTPNGEFFALGFASLVGSFFSCHTIAGSFTRSGVQAEAGARTPLTTAFTGAMLIIFLYTIIRVFAFLPVAGLAAVVLASTRPLISISDGITLWRCKRRDFVQLLVTFCAVVAAGISDGLLVGVGFSLATLLYRSFVPRLVELGRLPSTDVFVALDRYPEAWPVPGVLVLRLDGELHFGNVASVTGRLQGELDKAKGQAKARTDVASAAAGVAAAGSGSSSGSSASGTGSVAVIADAASGRDTVASGAASGSGSLLAGNGSAEVDLRPLAASSSASAAANSSNGRGLADVSSHGSLASTAAAAAGADGDGLQLQVQLQVRVPVAHADTDAAAAASAESAGAGAVAVAASSSSSSSNSANAGHGNGNNSAAKSTRLVYALATLDGHAGRQLDLLLQAAHKLPAHYATATGTGGSSASSSSSSPAASAAHAAVPFAFAEAAASSAGARRDGGTSGSAAPAPTVAGPPQPHKHVVSMNNAAAGASTSLSVVPAGLRTGLGLGEAESPVPLPRSQKAALGSHPFAPVGSSSGSSAAADAANGTQLSVQVDGAASTARPRLAEAFAGRVNPADTPLRAVILDASRVVDIDATACKELQSVMEAFQTARLEPRPQLLIAGLPGPVRDTLDSFGMRSNSDPATTRFLNVVAAIASLYEKELEEAAWQRITEDLAQLAQETAGTANRGGDSSSPDDDASTAKSLQAGTSLRARV